MKPKAVSVYISIKARGFSVAEVLLSLLLTAILASVLLSTLNHFMLNTKMLERHIKSDEDFIHLTQAVLLWIQASNFSPYGQSNSTIDIEPNQIVLSAYKTWMARGVMIKNTNEILLDSATTMDTHLITLFMPRKTMTLQVKNHYDRHIHFAEIFKQSQIIYLSDVHRIKIIFEPAKQAVYFQYDGLKPVILLAHVSQLRFKKAGRLLFITAIINGQPYHSECRLS